MSGLNLTGDDASHNGADSGLEFYEDFLPSAFLEWDNSSGGVFLPEHNNRTEEEDFISLNMSYVNSDFEAAVFALNKYGLPSIILIGVIGNSVSFIVFTTTHLRTQSSSIYLAFLNVVDVVFLLCISTAWLGWLRLHLVHGQGWCQTVIFLSYVSGFLSVWTVVSFTVERFLVVYLPLRRGRYSTKHRALGVVGALTLAAMGMYSYSVWMTGPYMVDGKKRCVTLPPYLFAVQILSSIDTFITLVLPSVVIVVLNVLIARKVWLFLRWKHRALGRPSDRRENAEMEHVRHIQLRTPAERNNHRIRPDRGHVNEVLPAGGNATCTPHIRQFTSAKRLDTDRTSSSSKSVHDEDSPFLAPVPVIRVSPPVRSPSQQTRSQARQNAVQMRTTRTLLIISSAFVVLNLPSHAFRVCATIIYLTNSTVVFSRTLLLWQHLFQMLYYANFSLNFFMYCTCSRRFRMALHLLVTRKCSKLRRLWETFSESMRLVARGGREQPLHTRDTPRTQALYPSPSPS